MPPANSGVEALPLHVMALGDGAFGSGGGWVSMRSRGWGPQDGISALVSRGGDPRAVWGQNPAVGLPETLTLTLPAPGPPDR